MVMKLGDVGVVDGVSERFFTQNGLVSVYLCLTALSVGVSASVRGA